MNRDHCYDANSVSYQRTWREVDRTYPQTGYVINWRCGVNGGTKVRRIIGDLPRDDIPSRDRMYLKRPVIQ